MKEMIMHCCFCSLSGSNPYMYSYCESDANNDAFHYKI